MARWAVSRGATPTQSDEDRTAAQRARFGLYLLLIGICFVGGGASRDDALSLLFVRPSAVLLTAIIMILPGRVDLRPIRVPLLICVALAAWTAVQLIPLPPSIWGALPGRRLFEEAAHLASIAQPWRPISISPDLTLNSLASLVVPIAVLLGYASLTAREREALLPVLIGAAMLSAVLGIAQLAGGDASSFRLYRITNRDSAVGFFANRNHQAALLAIAFPMLATWAVTRVTHRKSFATTSILCAALAVFLVPMILITGSRAGFVLGGASAAAAWFLYVYQAGMLWPRRARGRAMALGMAAILAIGALFSYVSFSRAEALQRILHEQVAGESRLQDLPLLADLAKQMMPLGSGVGTFDPLYRIHEPREALSPFYLNHAHNDLVELAITGGAPAVIFLLAGLGWIGLCTFKVFRAGNLPAGELAYARAGAVVMIALLAWSLIDYPLRTPIMAMVLAIAAGWLGSGARSLNSTANQSPTLPAGV